MLKELNKTKVTISAIKNLKRQIKEMKSGNLPYYTMPITQSKILEREGFIIRCDFGSIELTARGKDLIHEISKKNKLC